jgi:hypothetical protein
MTTSILRAIEIFDAGGWHSRGGLTLDLRGMIRMPTFSWRGQGCWHIRKNRTAGQ